MARLQCFITILICISGYVMSSTPIQSAQPTLEESAPSYNLREDFYYWRPYYGKIPPDAFVGGKEIDGSPTYIGTSHFFGKGVYPSIIKPNLNAYIVLGNTIIYSTRTKILCSTNNSLFKWIPTDTTKIKYLTDCQQIEGGEYGSGNSVITIGRANNQGRTITGRVFDDTSMSGLWIHDSNNKDLKLTQFEVLVYNCCNTGVE